MSEVPHTFQTAISIGQTRLELVQGDITQEETEAIANAANSRLAGGGGVDGAIHRAGGPMIMSQLKERYPNGCPTGKAVITQAGRLKARYVIHAVGPIYSGKEEDAQRLASAYRESLALCLRHGIRSIAFPSISTGAYGYPVHEAAPIALKTVVQFVKEHPGQLDRIRFVLFDEKTYQAYVEALRALCVPSD
jgi:O-acetyl-ADP-ribose deacetylase (regulator of RNase III)